MAPWIISSLIGGLAGILSGMFGVGGGIVLVPALVIFMGLSQHTANGTSLVALLAPVGILGVLQYFRAGKIGPENFKSGLFLALGLFVGAYLGATIAVQVPEAILRKSFAVFLVIVAIKLWFVSR